MTQEIDRDTFITAPEGTQRKMTFDMLSHISKQIEESHACTLAHRSDCNKRFTKLEERKTRDTATASLFGIVGGFVAVLGLQIKDWFK